MYVKINLLPKSYYEKKSAKILSVILFVVLVAVVGGLFFYKMNVIDTKIDGLNKKIAYAQNIKKQVDGLNAEVEQRKADVAYYTKRVDFMNDVLRFNKSIPRIFEDVAMWTYDKVQYQSLGTDGSSVTIRGRSRSLDDIGRYILNLYQAQNIFTSVTLSIDGLGGGSGGGRMGMPGMPGMSGGMPGMPGMSPSMPGAPGMGMPGGASRMPGMPGMGMPGMGGSMVAGSSVSSMNSGGWINFTINASLRNPISAPQWSEGASGGMGSGMGMRGMPGTPGMGMPGMMSPGMPGGTPGMPSTMSGPSTPGMTPPGPTAPAGRR